MLLLQTAQLTFSQVATGLVLTAINTALQGAILLPVIVFGIKWGIRLGLRAAAWGTMYDSNITPR